MRPTPAETIAGIRRILRDVVEPEVGSDYARSRLREVRAVLAQIDWDDAALRLREGTQTHRLLLQEVLDWATADPGRPRGLAGLDVPPPDDAGTSFADLNAARTAVAARLVEAARLLGTWSRAHPDDESARELLLRLLDRLHQPTTEESSRLA